MANALLVETLKKDAVELARAEAEYLKAKAKFENTVHMIEHGHDHRNGNGNGNSESQERGLGLVGIDVSKPLTQRVLVALEGSTDALALSSLAAMVQDTPRKVSATCSNLARTDKVESAGRGLWRLKRS